MRDLVDENSMFKNAMLSMGRGVNPEVAIWFKVWSALFNAREVMSLRHNPYICFVTLLERSFSNNAKRVVQCPRLFWARIMLKWDNKYLGIQEHKSWSVYGDSNSFSMVVLGKKMNCQKVPLFLLNLPTLKKRTHQFWDSKVSGAFPGGPYA